MALLLPHCYSFRFFFPLLDSGNCINDHCSSDCSCAKPQGDDSNSFGLCQALFRNMCFIVIFDPFLRVFVQFFNVHTKYIYIWLLDIQFFINIMNTLSVSSERLYSIISFAYGIYKQIETMHPENLMI